MMSVRMTKRASLLRVLVSALLILIHAQQAKNASLPMDVSPINVNNRVIQTNQTTAMPMALASAVANLHVHSCAWLDNALATMTATAATHRNARITPV